MLCIILVVLYIRASRNTSTATPPQTGNNGSKEDEAPAYPAMQPAMFDKLMSSSDLLL